MSAGTISTLTAKVVLLGESATGAKTSLALRFVLDIFDERPTPTIGAAFMCKVVEVDSVKVKLEIWGLHLNTMNRESTYNALNVHAHRYGRTRTVPVADTDVLPRRTSGNCGL